LKNGVISERSIDWNDKGFKNTSKRLKS